MKDKRIIYVSGGIKNLLRYGKPEQLRSFKCECGMSAALETKYTIWVLCESCKKLGY